MSPPPITAAVITNDASQYEQTHVHAVYDEIASHFSNTRYKPWPVIAEFMTNLPTGWVGLDSGTGNGKYLPLPLDRPGSIWTIGLDRSRNLLQTARSAGDAKIIREVVRGDALSSGWRLGAFDYAISIATIHHLATPERRQLAVQRLIESVSPEHGRVLLYVWAIEQDELSKRQIPPGEQDKVGQDVFIPWVLSMKGEKTSSRPESRDNVPSSTPTKIYNRYYHMFSKGELAQLATSAAQALGLQVGSRDGSKKTRGIAIIQDGWERSNYYVELRRWEA